MVRRNSGGNRKRKSKYGLNPTLSQVGPEGQTHSGVEDDDLHLCLSQSQQVETQQSLDGTGVSDVTTPDSDVEICQIDGESQRVTRNSTKMHKTTDEELVSIQRQAESMKEEIDDVIDDDLTLMLSQSQRDSGADQPSLVDLAASASQVKCNVDRIEEIIQMNQKTMLSQNQNVLKLISGISTHVANISDRLLTLENKVESMNIKVESNTSAIKAIERNMAALNAMDKNKDWVIQLDQRIKLVENKLSEQSAIAQVNNNIHNTNDRKPTNETTCGKIVVAENAIVIHNLAYRQRDVEDVNKMMSRGLNLGIKAKTIHRAPSRYHNAGVLTVEMHSLDDKAAVLKRRALLSNNNQLNNVVIKSFKTPTHVQIENKFDSLINAMHMKVFNRDRSAYNRINGFRPYTKGY